VVFLLCEANYVWYAVRNVIWNKHATNWWHLSQNVNSTGG